MIERTHNPTTNKPNRPAKPPFRRQPIPAFQSIDRRVGEILRGDATFWGEDRRTEERFPVGKFCSEFFPFVFPPLAECAEALGDEGME